MSKSISDVEKNDALGDRFVFGDFQFNAELLAKMTMLVAYAPADWATPRIPGKSSGYIVPPEKKFIVAYVRIQNQLTTGAANNALGLQSATSDVGFGSASRPTGCDDAQSAGINPFFTIEAAAGELYEEVFPYVVNEGRYLAAFCQGGNSFWQIYGFEVDADADTI